MRCEFFSDATNFLDAAGAFLARGEAENTVALGAALRCRRKPQRDAVMAVVQSGDIVRLVAIMTPPHGLAVSAGDSKAIPHLVEALRRAAVRPPDVFGLGPLAEYFAALWQGGGTSSAAPQTILYRSDRIRVPENVPGELRTAAAHDRDWLAAWQRRFAEQASLSAAEQAADMRAIVAARIARGEMHY